MIETMSNRPTIALIYDFDGTLSPGNMQEYDFIPAVGKSNKEFWHEANSLAEEQDADGILTYMTKMIQAAKKLDAIAEYGSILALSYVAAQRTFYGYNDMADAKALLESIARSFGYIYGREHNVRVNTISQSPTMTTAGSGVQGMEKLFDFANRMSPLGNASAEECADYCIVMFSDLTRKVTMQNLYHDGGFSSVGMSLRAMATYEKGLEEYMDENGNIIYG